MSAGAMKTQLHRFYLWLFPDRFKETATCKYCGVEVSKSRMCFMEGDWFAMKTSSQSSGTGIRRS